MSSDYGEHPWRDEDVMRELYVEEELTSREVAKRLDCAPQTVYKWLKRHGIEIQNRRSTRRTDGPWKDGEELRRLYVEERMSTTEIAMEWDCAVNTVGTWLEKHGIEKRDLSSAQRNVHYDKRYEVPFTLMDQDGYAGWNKSGGRVYVHRLLMMLEEGPEAVAGMHVHHKNEIPWDNRVENLELKTPSEHHSGHLKIGFIDRLAIAEMYENTDASSRDVASAKGVSSPSVLRIHKEVTGA